MSGNYVPLYRKYRPQTLEQLVGQEHIKKTLTSAIELGKIAHAFLFTGPRGTGKTSTARILAKSLNCKNGPTIHPCGECESCRDITNSVPIDVIEIDAASNRKVEDTQNILEKIQYVPVNGKYKIYIIDEVHMLTNHAFNALLKTLEEPPENVIFILATTEVHKVLDTIKSRCQRFDFRRITTEDIVKHLRYISDNEKINISDDALFAIAKNSAGGMRDSISLLDQLSLLGVSKEVTVEDVNAILGRISFDTLNKLSSKIIASSPNEAIEILNEIYNAGNEPLQILTNLSEYFKNLLIVKTCRKELLQELTGLNEPQIAEMLKQKDLLETQQIVFDLANMTENSTLIDLQNRVKALEGGSIPAAQPVRPVIQPPQPQVSALKPVENIRKQDDTEPVTRPAPIPPAESPAAQTIKQDIEEFTPPPMSKKPDGNDINTLWQALLVNIKSPATKALLHLATPVKIAADEVIITFKNDKLVSQINDTNKKQMLIEAANTMFNQENSRIIVRLPQSGDAALSSSAAQTPSIPQEEKKNITPEPVKIPEPAILQPEETVPMSEEIQETAETSEIANSEAVETSNSKKPERMETDQEKMVLELFDGKYIE